MKKIAFALCLSSLSSFAFAHFPFVAPINYWVNGGHSAVISGFAAHALDSEIAIKGFDFNVINPNGEQRHLDLVHVHSLSMADINTAESGTYQILGIRTAELPYAKIGQRWLKVLDAKAEKIPPLSERQFVLPRELNSKTTQMTVKRYDQVISYLSKTATSALHINNQGLNIAFSQHPNKLSLQQPLTLTLTYNQQPAVDYIVSWEKQQQTEAEKTVVMQELTNQQGQVVLPFSAVRQYVVTIRSPEPKVTQKPVAETYRTRVTVYVGL